MRYEVVDLVIREISLFFTCIDQLFYVFKFIVKSQLGVSSNCLVPLPRERCEKKFLKGGKLGCCRIVHGGTNLQSLAHKCCSVYRLPAVHPTDGHFRALRRPTLHILDGKESLFVSSTFLVLRGNLQPTFGQARIAQGAADTLQFSQQFP